MAEGLPVPDVYAAIAEVDPAIVTRLTDVLEHRAAEPQQRVMLRAYLLDIALALAGRRGHLRAQRIAWLTLGRQGEGR